MKKSRSEIYVSVDVEADGPCPGVNSMLSLGAAAFTAEGKFIGQFSENLERLPDSKPDSDTMKWWIKQGPEVWKIARENCVLPSVVMTRFYEWVKGRERAGKGRAVLVAFPAGFDFTFVYYYLHRFLPKDQAKVFGFQTLDLKTFAWALLGGEKFFDAVKAKAPRHWFAHENKHSHVAVEDAIEQGRMFFAMREDLKKLLRRKQ